MSEIYLFDGFVTNPLMSIGKNALINTRLDQKMDESVLLIYSVASKSIFPIANAIANVIIKIPQLAWRADPSTIASNSFMEELHIKAISILISNFAGKYFTELTCKKPITTKQALITSSADWSITTLSDALLGVTS